MTMSNIMAHETALHGRSVCKKNKPVKCYTHDQTFPNREAFKRHLEKDHGVEYHE